MLNELKTRNKTDKTFSTAHILKIGHLIIYVASVSNFVEATIAYCRNQIEKYFIFPHFIKNGQRRDTLIQILKYIINGKPFTVKIFVILKCCYVVKLQKNFQNLSYNCFFNNNFGNVYFEIERMKKRKMTKQHFQRPASDKRSVSELKFALHFYFQEI